LVVGVLRGGPSSEYEVSLKSGATVLQELDRAKYEPRDLFVSRDGTWNIGGREMPISRALQGIDVVFNAMHGEYGEDGTVQRILDTFGTPYTGSDSFGSALAFNKLHAKGALAGSGIRMPSAALFEIHDEGQVEKEAMSIFRGTPSPWVVKPVAAGSSVGTTVATDYHGLIDALNTARAVSPRIMIEEFVKGREGTCGVTDAFRGEDVYAFFPVEIIPPKGSLCWTYEAKYDGSTQELCPSTFSDEQKQEIADIARKAHKALGLRHYSRTDFIVTPKGVYFLETNTLPGLTSESLLPKAVKAAGTKLGDFFDHLIQLALKK
jgi:D-alanine-D-alanine ligase